MAKGATCPSCGGQTWQKVKQGGRTCSGCGARGWLGSEAPTGGGGTGKECKLCGTRTLQLADQEGDVQIRMCTSCRAVVVTK
jgi:hypothetical protein